MVESSTENEAAGRIVADVAIKMIELAPNQVPQNILSAVQRMAPQVSAKEVLYKALQILRAPNADGNPRFDAIEKRADPLIRAHWLSLDDEERRYKGDQEEKYVKQETQAIYSVNDVKEKQVGGLLKGLTGKARQLLR
jgi:hypothetical protein